MGFSGTRARTRVPCTVRWVLNHCTTREVLEHISNTITWSTKSCMIRILSSPPTSFGATFLLAPATLAFPQIYPTLSYLRPYIHVIPPHSSYISLNATSSESTFITLPPHHKITLEAEEQQVRPARFFSQSMVYFVNKHVN